MQTDFDRILKYNTYLTKDDIKEENKKILRKFYRKFGMCLYVASFLIVAKIYGNECAIPLFSWNMCFTFSICLPRFLKLINLFIHPKKDDPDYEYFLKRAKKQRKIREIARWIKYFI